MKSYKNSLIHGLQRCDVAEVF